MHDDQTPINAGSKRRLRLPGWLEAAAMGVEEQVLWRLADALRALAELIRRGCEGVAWALRRRILWPLQDRVPALDRPGAGPALGLVAVLVLGAGALALALGSSGGSQPQPQPLAAVGATTPEPSPAPATPGPEPERRLHGVAPSFEPAAPRRSGGGKAKEKPQRDGIDRVEGRRPEAPVSDPASETISSSPGAGASRAGASAATVSGPPAGPAAIAVARRFADAFVVYETGGEKEEVRRALKRTATPELTRSLLRRPPRLPEGVEVPRAKVVNVVAGPSSGGIYPVSVSLLRVGTTSELRLDMQKLKGAGWRVTNVLG